MQRRLLSTLLVLLPGCFGVCGPGDQEFYAEAGCVAQAAPDSPEIQFGTAEGEPFSPLKSGSLLEMDYGPQGGQHVYVSLRIFGAVEGDRLLLSLGSGGIGLSAPSTLNPCADGQWIEILDDYVQFSEAEEQTTTIEAKLLRCTAAEECDFYFEGGVEPEVITTSEIEITAIP